jgi:hypothetical protein
MATMTEPKTNILGWVDLDKVVITWPDLPSSEFLHEDYAKDEDDFREAMLLLLSVI